MKKLYLVLLLFLCCIPSEAQRFIAIKDKAFNYGAKIGFNATFPIINSLTVDEAEAENVRLQYKVGYQASIFCRVNVERFFIQPSLSWSRTEGDIHFSIPTLTNSPSLNEDPALALNYIQIRSSSLDLPILIGYNLVKEGPYGLSFMVGPKLKYNYKEHYTTRISNSSREYTNGDNPFGLNIVSGLSVSIWRLFLDFSYEFGLNRTTSDFRDMETQFPIEDNISINKRTNVMTFSLGFLL